MARKVLVCFVRSDSDLLQQGSILNRMAAYYGSGTREAPMVHAELFFPKPGASKSADVFGESCGIHYGGKVFMAPKTFSRNNWVFRTYSVSDDAYRKVKEFCADRVGDAFNYLGYFTPCNLSRSTAPSNGRSWYCSELVAAALHEGGLLDAKDLKYASAHPDLLYDTIVRDTYADCGRNIESARLQV